MFSNNYIRKTNYTQNIFLVSDTGDILLKKLAFVVIHLDMCLPLISSQELCTYNVYWTGPILTKFAVQHLNSKFSWTPPPPIPMGDNFEVTRVKLIYFLKNLLLYSWAQFRQTEYKVMMTKEVSTKIVNFMTPWAEILLLGCGHISHIQLKFY